MSVILIGGSDDPQIQDLDEALDERGVEVDVWDAHAWPGESHLSLDMSDGHRTVLFNREEIGDVSTIFIRNLSLDARAARFEEELEERPFSLLNQLHEYRGLIVSALQMLESRKDIAVINPTRTLSVHFAKPLQLSVFADQGLPIPDTLTTNDPEAVRAFVNEYGAAVFKPVSGGGYARLLNAKDLETRELELLANSPVQFQEYVDGDSLRLYVVGGEVVAAGRMLSDEIDYRTEPHDVEVIEPSDEIAEAAVDAAWALGLTFAGIDIIDEGDRFVLLEANPSPMFSVFDDLAETDVCGSLADFIASEPTVDD